jgi:hypothetical protein
MPKVKVYEVGGLLGVKVQQYLYFAASVFWRASARSWSHDGRLIYQIDLGSLYLQQFREYLLGTAPFPSNARLFVHVRSDDSAGFATVFPCTSRIKGTLRHKFCVPGILFILFLGQQASHSHDAGALNGSNGHFVWVCPFEADSLFEGFGKLIRQAQRGARHD